MVILEILHDECVVNCGLPCISHCNSCFGLGSVEDVHVDISDIGYCMCQPNVGMLSGFSTCYMKSQAGD